MTGRRRFLLGLAAAGFSHAAAARASAAGRKLHWRILGRCLVAEATAESRIELPRGGVFRALRLKAGGRALRLDRLRLHFAGGVSVELPEPRDVPRDGVSDAIALPGGLPGLEAVELTWRAVAGSGQDTGRASSAPPGETVEVTLLGLAA